MTLQVVTDGPHAVVRLDKPRGNSIDETLARELARVAEELGRDDGVRGVLLASAHPTLFCPGLDLVALAEHDRDAMRGFMLTFARALWGLYGLPKPVVAALGGAAVAGGCLLALTADHRMLCRGAVIGLNEVKVGVPLPWSVTVLVRATVNPAAIGQVALLGRNFTDEAAVQVGLAHEVHPTDGFEAACLERLAEFTEKDTRALATTKCWLREPVLCDMRAHESERIESFLDGWFAEQTRERLRATVGRLHAHA